MRTWFIALLAIGISGKILAQEKRPSPSLNLQVQAGLMAEALKKGDYPAFVDYNYPQLVKMAGGREKMIAVLTKTVDDMQREGMQFGQISFDRPSTIVHKGKEWQSVLPQHTEFILTRGRVVSTSVLIAISVDEGRHWKFIDTSKKDGVEVRKVFPNISSELVIPPPRAPVRYDN